MMFDKKIQEIVRNEDIPYKWLFSYGETHFQDLTGQELEGIFPDLYRWTKVAFRQSKPNAFNLLYNLLWMDKKIDILNWEYSNLDHYKSRLVLRCQNEAEVSPGTILSFLKGEKEILGTLSANLSKGQIGFFEFPNTRDETFYFTTEIDSARISQNDQSDLMGILMERVMDKLKYVDLLLNSETERNLVLNLSNEKTEEGEDTEVTDEYINKFKGVFSGKDEDSRKNLIKRFKYLEDNVNITTNRGNAKIIKYSAIFCALSALIDDSEIKKQNLGWKIHKKLLGDALGIRLISGPSNITPEYIDIATAVLNGYN